jgi:ribA/ribD-fused uncharacterized protein
MTTIIPFFRKSHFLSQWHEISFTITLDLPDELLNIQLLLDRPDILIFLQNQTMNCAEQFMMVCKALLFGDQKIATKILQEPSQINQKKLGRRVKNFDPIVWNTYCMDIVLLGSYFKFSQNDDIKRRLLETGTSILVEASPYDKIWGIGMSSKDPNINNPKLWKGKNKLGICLMKAREIIATN